ncbi:MAG: hypothetical protein QXL94_07245 [Candidatus Parvarchaeum sp.]
MNWHVFVVDSDSYPVHRDRLFCGVKNPNRLNTRGNLNVARFGVYADLKALRKGDIVFFYQKRIKEEKLDRGFRGIFKVKSEPFFDTADIDGVATSTGSLGSANKKVLGKCPYCSSDISEGKRSERIRVRLKNRREKEKKVSVYYCKHCHRKLDFHILPNRVLIEPIALFANETGSEAVIDDNTAYIDRNYIKENLPILWTMLFRKTYGRGRERSITHILPEEAHKLELIFNEKFTKIQLPKIMPYQKPATATPITIPLECNSDGELKIEALLEAWIMENIDKEIPVLKDIIGDVNQLEYFGNNVLYGIGGENVDVLCIHKVNNKRNKATVIELKKGSLKIKDVAQVLDYTKWMSQLIFGDDKKESKEKIQPVLIGFKADDKVVAYARKIKVETQKPILLIYKVDNGTIRFERVL